MTRPPDRLVETELLVAWAVSLGTGMGGYSHNDMLAGGGPVRR
jgi:hypothetical protein